MVKEYVNKNTFDYFFSYKAEKSFLGVNFRRVSYAHEKESPITVH